MKKHIFSSLMLLFPIFIFSQSTFRGMIMDRENPKDNQGVYGVNVRWLNTEVGSTLYVSSCILLIHFTLIIRYL